MSTPRLDGHSVRRRRIEIGLSARSLASYVGVSTSWVTSVESGVNHDEVSLRQLGALASALAMNLHELVIDSDDELPAVGPDSDVQRLGLILADLTTQVPIDRLCRVLGWTTTRMQTAVTVLSQRLQGTGLRLSEGVHGIHVVRDSVSPDAALPALLRGRMADHGLTVSHARMLHQVLSGAVTERSASPAAMKESQRVTIAELVNAELIRLPDSGSAQPYTVVEHVRESLLLARGSRT